MVINNTPSHPQNPITFLARQYKPQDSTVLFKSDDRQILNVPGASFSLSTINSGDQLVAPGHPSLESGWPLHNGPLIASLNNNLVGHDLDVYSCPESDVFIVLGSVGLLEYLESSLQVSLLPVRGSKPTCR
jgi:hypothetical protein